MLIAVIGLNGSGKDTVADYISEKYNFEKISLSSIVREEVVKAGLDPLNRDNMNQISEGLRKKDGSDYLMQRVIKKYSQGKNFVLSSFRHPSEIDVVKNNGGVVIRVDVDLKTRYLRTIQRVKNDPTAHGDIGTFEEFVAKQERELSNPDNDKMQINEVMKMSDYIIDNNSTLEDLNKKVNNLMCELLEKKPNN